MGAERRWAANPEMRFRKLGVRLVRGIPQGRVIEGGGIPIELRRFADVR